MNEYFIKFIKESLESVEQKYYSIPIAHHNKEIIRERMFCYEFYHQMRLKQKPNSPIQIHGEIDKNGYPKEYNLKRRNPDFIFHQSGNQEKNMVIMEVKGRIHGPAIKKDFETITHFLNKDGLNYRIGVFVLFNHSQKDLTTSLRSTNLENGYCEYAERIWIITAPCHEKIEDPIRLSELL